MGNPYGHYGSYGITGVCLRSIVLFTVIDVMTVSCVKNTAPFTGYRITCGMITVILLCTLITMVSGFYAR